jgi:hypothetical protein
MAAVARAEREAVRRTIRNLWGIINRGEDAAEGGDKPSSPPVSSDSVSAADYEPSSPPISSGSGKSIADVLEDARANMRVRRPAGLLCLPPPRRSPCLT